MTVAPPAYRSVIFFGCLALTGCALSNPATPSAEPPVIGAAIQGIVHGGQQPVAGAHVYMFAAGTSGYGGNGIAASTSNASASVWTAAETGQSDSVGPYILTTAGGNFTFPAYTCTPGTQVYLYVLGGNPGNGTNSALGLMAALGNCPTAGNLNSITYISINEISTIAAAYALAGFATDATHIGSSGTALAKVGIANAFLNATNLANIATGAALAITPAGNGTVPHDEIVTLADILAYCVNSNNTSTTISANCSTLFGYSLSGGTAGTTPTDTASAAINIAHNPGANVGNLFGLAAAKSPYVTTNSYSQPNDWTLALGLSPSGVSNPNFLSIDASGSVWIANPGVPGSVSKLSSLGAVLSGASNFTGAGIKYPEQVVIDSSGYAWIANYSNSSVSKLSNSGLAISGTNGYTGGTLNEPQFLSVDNKGNIWAANYGGNCCVTELSSTGTISSGASGYNIGTILFPNYIANDAAGNAWLANDYNGGSLVKLSSSGAASTFAVKSPEMIAFDASGNVWVASDSPSSVVKLSSAGSILSGSGGYTGGGIYNPVGIAIDGANNAWIANYGNGKISQLSNMGAILSGSTGYVPSGGGSASGLAIDASGDVWFTSINGSGTPVFELVGAAAPAVVPLAAAASANTFGTRP